MARRSIRQRHYDAYNALPQATLGPLYKAAKLDDVLEYNEDGPVFIIQWRHGDGVNREDMKMVGGADAVLLREDEAHVFVRKTRQLGGIIVPNDLGPEEYEVEKLKQTLAVAKSCRTFFGDKGIKMVKTLMSNANPPRPFADLEDWKTDYAPCLINEQRHQLLVKFTKTTTKQLATAKKNLAAVTEAAA